MPEDTVNEFNSTFEEMLGIHPSSNELVKDTAQTVRHLAKMGRCVVIGRGSHIVTRRMKDGLHIRLVGSLEKRAERLAIEHNFTTSAAIEFIKREDRARARYLTYYYATDINDPTKYDLTYQYRLNRLVECRKPNRINALPEGLKSATATDLINSINIQSPT